MQPSPNSQTDVGKATNDKLSPEEAKLVMKLIEDVEREEAEEQSALIRAREAKEGAA